MYGIWVISSSDEIMAQSVSVMLEGSLDTVHDEMYGASLMMIWWIKAVIQHSLKLCSVAQIERCIIIHQFLIMGGKCWEVGERVDLLVRFWWLLYCGSIFKIHVQYPWAINQPGFLSYQMDNAFIRESGIKRKRCLPGRTENPVWIAALGGLDLDSSVVEMYASILSLAVNQVMAEQRPSLASKTGQLDSPTGLFLILFSGWSTLIVTSPPVYFISRTRREAVLE